MGNENKSAESGKLKKPIPPKPPQPPTPPAAPPPRAATPPAQPARIEEQVSATPRQILSSRPSKPAPPKKAPPPTPPIKLERAKEHEGYKVGDTVRLPYTGMPVEIKHFYKSVDGDWYLAHENGCVLMAALGISQKTEAATPEVPASAVPMPENGKEAVKEAMTEATTEATTEVQEPKVEESPAAPKEEAPEPEVLPEEAPEPEASAEPETDGMDEEDGEES